MNSDEVQSKIEELEALKKQTGYWKLGGTLALITIAVTIVLQIIFGFKSLAEKGPAQDKFLSHLKEAAEHQIIPSLKEAAKTAQNKATAALKLEVEKLGDRLPELTEQAKSEAMLLAEELQNDADKVMERTFWAMLKEREADIRKNHPEVSEENVATALNNLQGSVESEFSKASESLFVDHLVVINGILENLTKIRDSDTTDLLDKDAPWEMGLLVFEIVREEFSDPIDLP